MNKIINLKNVHRKNKCRGEFCVIHKPSNHKMKEWPIHFRDDKYVVERICKHGIGHPDPDDVYYQEKFLGRTELCLHGCDGCCSEK